jgi:hypothetical protein
MLLSAIVPTVHSAHAADGKDGTDSPVCAHSRSSAAYELALCGIERDAGLMKVVQRETGGAAATDTGAAIFLGVVAGMTAALGFDPLSELQLVSELQHGLLRGERTGPLRAPVVDS